MSKAICSLLLVFSAACWAHTDEARADSFDAYLQEFDNRERIQMKIEIPELLELYRQGRAQIIDIRTPQEHAAFHLDFMTHIPVNELPARLDELDRSKTIIPVCSVYVRAAIVRTYLTLRGYDSRYLVEGMTGFAGYLKTPGAVNSLHSILSGPLSRTPPERSVVVE